MFKEDEKSKAICLNCGMVETIFKVRDIPIHDTNGIAKNILVGVCTVCDETISIPQQSANLIKESISLTEKEALNFLEVIDNPPEPNEDLKLASIDFMKKYDLILNSEFETDYLNISRQLKNAAKLIAFSWENVAIALSQSSLDVKEQRDKTKIACFNAYHEIMNLRDKLK